MSRVRQRGGTTHLRPGASLRSPRVPPPRRRARSSGQLNSEKHQPSTPTRQPTHQVDETFDAYVLDMDGTVYLGDDLLPGVADLIEAVVRSGRKYAFSTNNSTRSRADYAALLRRLGVPATTDHVVTSGSLTAAWIRRHHPGARCFVVGEPPLLNELALAGVELTEDPVATTLVVSSFDRTLTYAKLQTAFDALRGRPQTGFIATHPDAYRPMPAGGGQPDAAAVTAAIAACTGRRCQAVIGKPSPAMMTTACAQLGVPTDRAILVGDRLTTDIAAGIAAGARTALVLTGETSLADVAVCPATGLPDYILERIDRLAEPLLRRHPQGPDAASPGSARAPGREDPPAP